MRIPRCLLLETLHIRCSFDAFDRENESSTHRNAVLIHAVAGAVSSLQHPLLEFLVYHVFDSVEVLNVLGVPGEVQAVDLSSEIRAYDQGEPRLNGSHAVSESILRICSITLTALSVGSMDFPRYFTMSLVSSAPPNTMTDE